MDGTQLKLANLKTIIAEFKSVLVGFSGGVDSSFLLKVAYDTLAPIGGRVLAVTARSPLYPEREFNDAVTLAKTIGVEQMIVDVDELSSPSFSQNPPDRCYHCKTEIFGRFMDIARREGIATVLDGANADDLSDYRPGSVAAKELGVRSPLQETGLTKAEIRSLSRELGLPTWDKPSFACLASRFPYGTAITMRKLSMVGEAEEFLRGLGFTQLRVRHHGDVARIELPPEDIARAVEPVTAELIHATLKKIGFTYVSVDIRGYRTGSMNEGL